ncbi:MAG: EF-hand domain-containing protein [Rhodobiaceae bacterium]|nr:EF-hand domain-containing protein [Rhodobiaceae bacterium]
MNKLTPAASAILLLALAIPVAHAQNQVPGQHFVENWDLNGDGKVTLEEAKERRGDVFASFDTNEDGYLDAEEYVMFDEARANDMAEAGGHQRGMRNAAEGMRLEMNDVDGDGKVSRDEFLGRAKDWLAFLDSNGDGVVTTDDFGRGRGRARK